MKVQQNEAEISCEEEHKIGPSGIHTTSTRKESHENTQYTNIQIHILPSHYYCIHNYTMIR